MLVVETIAKIRRAFFVQGKSIKAICRELRDSRKVAGSNPAGVATLFVRISIFKNLAAGLPIWVRRFATRCCRFSLTELVHGRFGHSFATGLLDVDLYLSERAMS